MIRFVYFDLGKVLYDFDYRPLQENIRSRSRLDAEQLTAMIDDDTLIVRYETGEFTTPEFLHLIKQRFALEEDLETIHLAWNSIFSPLPDNLNAALETAESIPCGILSNTSDSHYEFLRPQHPFLHHPSVRAVLSYRARVRKPDEAIYREAMRVAGVEPESILYLDDLVPNVATARDLGWRAVLVEPEMSIREVLVEYGVLPPA